MLVTGENGQLVFWLVNTYFLTCTLPYIISLSYNKIELEKKKHKGRTNEVKCSIKWLQWSDHYNFFLMVQEWDLLAIIYECRYTFFFKKMNFYIGSYENRCKKWTYYISLIQNQCRKCMLFLTSVSLKTVVEI